MELDDLMPIAMKNPQPEDNILTQKSESMQVKIEDGELNYWSNSITMDSDPGEIVIDSRFTSCISRTIEAFFGELFDYKLRIKVFGGNRSPLINKGALQCKWEDDTVT